MLFPHFLLIQMFAECVDSRFGRDSLGAFVGVVELSIASIFLENHFQNLGATKDSGNAAIVVFLVTEHVSKRCMMSCQDEHSDLAAPGASETVRYNEDRMRVDD